MRMWQYAAALHSLLPALRERTEVSKYRKGLIALSGVLAVLGKALADGAVDAGETVEILTAALVAFGVYRVPNDQ